MTGGPASAALCRGVLRRADPAMDHGIHLPQPSFWPLVTSLGIFIGAWGNHLQHPRAGHRRGDHDDRHVTRGRLSLSTTRSRVNPTSRRSKRN